ncbi:MAG: hypothetical protein IJI54_02570 [Kiritimatiellae bacterium]|nr:hypothetical protein [Kiritimatiellia bacterium]MBQ6140143.1 hypothetical protein [Kiritimatiellia bacterium]
MMGFGLFGRIRQRTRRLLAAAGVALLLGFQTLSAIYITHEADHDCNGDDCPICVQLQQCVANFQLTGSGLEADAASVSLPVFAADRIIPVDVALPNRSLVAQKIQFNE